MGADGSITDYTVQTKLDTRVASTWLSTASAIPRGLAANILPTLDCASYSVNYGLAPPIAYDSACYTYCRPAVSS